MKRFNTTKSVEQTPQRKLGPADRTNTMGQSTPGKGGDMFDNVDPDKLDWREMFLQEKMVGEPQSIPQSVIYELVNETINKEAYNISCPKGNKAIFRYIL